MKKIVVYYVDYENVSNAGIVGIEELDERDVVNLIYSKNAHSMHLYYVEKLMQSKASIKFIEMPDSPNGKTIKNAMDFFLIGLLFSSDDRETKTYIVSGDTGYDFAIKAGKINGYHNIRRITSINKSLNDKPSIPKNETRARQILAECLREMLDYKQIETYSTDIIGMIKVVTGNQAKSQFYNAIVHRWKRKRGLPIYNAIKNRFDELCNLIKSDTIIESQLETNFKETTVTTLSA